MTEHHYHDRSHNLREMVQNALARSPYFAGRNLQIEVADDSVLLTGVVYSYYQKQLAQESIRAIEGVNRIRNELEVISV